MLTGEWLIRRKGRKSETAKRRSHAGSHNRRVVNMLKKLVALAMALTFAPVLASLSGCNTVQGAGEDISKGGQKVEKEAAEHKHY